MGVIQVGFRRSNSVKQPVSYRPLGCRAAKRRLYGHRTSSCLILKADSFISTAPLSRDSGGRRSSHLPLSYPGNLREHVWEAVADVQNGCGLVAVEVGDLGDREGYVPLVDLLSQVRLLGLDIALGDVDPPDNAAGRPRRRFRGYPRRFSASFEWRVLGPAAERRASR
jgi:hypothetical protein